MIFSKKQSQQFKQSIESPNVINTDFSERSNSKQTDLSELLSQLLPERQSLFAALANGQLPRQNLADESLRFNSRFDSQVNNQVNNQDTQQKSWLKRLVALPAYYWVLISQAAVILPHFAHMPTWLVSYGLFSLVMQLPKVKQKFTKNQYSKKQCLKKHILKKWYRSIQLIAFLLGVGGLWWSFGGFNVEAGVAFLLLCLASKMWEMYQRRDAFVILNLSLFVCASLFLLDQGLNSSIQAFTATMMVLMAFVSMNDDRGLSQLSQLTQSSKQPFEQKELSEGSGRLRTVAMLAGLSFPLMIVIFLFFPRLPPLWSLQLSSSQAKTGVSNSMSPGDFANLSQSTELAFRVEFEDKTPMFANMYWRGLVFSDFDGETWTGNQQLKYWIDGQPKPDWFAIAEKTTTQPSLNYQVILEPTNQRWLFALDYPNQLGKKHSITSNYSLTSLSPVIQQQRYKQSYKPNMQIGLPLSEQARTINLVLPKNGNGKARQLASKLYAESVNDAGYIKAVAKWINQGQFRYTLSPPALGKERIDEFLFDTQAGFCEHYSSTFVFMMRAAGIPARVVVGYHGGELGRDGKSWEVRQMDAHAWAEVWLKESGWTRIDPTSWVAPERVEKGMDALSNTQGSRLFGDGMFAEISYQQYKMLQDIRRISDQMSYYWDRDIVGFDSNKQSDSLLKWFDIKNWYQQVITMIVLFISLVVVVSLWLWWKRRTQWHIADHELMKLSKRLGKKNEYLIRADDEGMLAWIERLEKIDDCSLDTSILIQVKRSYRKLRYGRLSAIKLGDIKLSDIKIMQTEYQIELKQLNNMIKGLK